MIHGILDSSDGYVVRGKDSDAITLVQEGYDVWLGNSRGNKYSKDHMTLDHSRHDEYWNFSFEELGKYDIPSFIEFILNRTGYSKLAYVGHSMGNTQIMYAMT